MALADDEDMVAIRADRASLLKDTCIIKRIPLDPVTHIRKGTPATVATTTCNVLGVGSGTAPAYIAALAAAGLSFGKGRIIDLPQGVDIHRDDELHVGSNIYKVKDYQTDLTYLGGVVVMAEKLSPQEP